MNDVEDIARARVTEKLSRRSLLTKFGAAGIGAAATAMLAGCGGSSSGGSASGLNQQIINAAATAEALATVLYTKILTSPAYAKLGSLGNTSDQAYLSAALEQEYNHYQTLVAAGAVPLTTTFYFPTATFTDDSYVTTLDVLVKLEYIFIAAYLIGVRDLSSSALKVLAAQILGVESEHRALARVIATDLGLPYVTDVLGVQEDLTAPTYTANNIAYERTYSAEFPNIGAVVAALTPFTVSSALYSAGPFTLGSPSTTGPVTQNQTSPTFPD